LRALAVLPFHSHWRTVASLLAARKPGEAEQALRVLPAEVISSPDLTENDRLLAIGGYDVAYTKFAAPLLAKPGGAQITRGFRSATPLTELKAEALKRQKHDPATAAALDAIVLDLQRPAGGGGRARGPMQCSRGRLRRCASRLLKLGREALPPPRWRMRWLWERRSA
jgi:hypothetical protein